MRVVVLTHNPSLTDCGDRGHIPPQHRLPAPTPRHSVPGLPPPYCGRKVVVKTVSPRAFTMAMVNWPLASTVPTPKLKKVLASAKVVMVSKPAGPKANSRVGCNVSSKPIP